MEKMSTSNVTSEPISRRSVRPANHKRQVLNTRIWKSISEAHDYGLQHWPPFGLMSMLEDFFNSSRTGATV